MKQLRLNSQGLVLLGRCHCFLDYRVKIGWCELNWLRRRRLCSAATASLPGVFASDVLISSHMRVEVMNHVIWNQPLSWIIDLLLWGDSNERLPGRLAKHFSYSSRKRTHTPLEKVKSKIETSRYWIKTNLEPLNLAVGSPEMNNDAVPHRRICSSHSLAGLPWKKNDGLREGDHRSVTCSDLQCLAVWAALVVWSWCGSMWPP